MKKWTLTLAILGVIGLCALLRQLYIIYYAPNDAFSTPAPVADAVKTPKPTPSQSDLLAAEQGELLMQADTDFMQNRVNILLVGFDESPERDESGNDVYRDEKNNFRSDVLMLAAVNFGENALHLISIPRDTYTPIYGTRGRYKINAAFAKGGAAEGEGFLYAKKTVEMLMGVPIDYYAGVNMAGMKALVDAMGGVDYDVDVEIKLNGRVLKTGYQHLDGQQVLDYCRARKGISTDVGRNDRQQRMLVAIFTKLKEQDMLYSLPKLFSAVKDDLYTNLSAAQVAALAAFGLRLPVDGIRRSTLEGEYISNVYNASYYVLSNKKLVRLVKEEFGITITRDNKYDVATVKRDKEAAIAKAKLEEEKRKQEEAEKLQQQNGDGSIPTGTDGMESLREALRAPLERARQQLDYAIENGADEDEIRRRLHEFMVAWKRYEKMLSGN